MRGEASFFTRPAEDEDSIWETVEFTGCMENLKMNSPVLLDTCIKAIPTEVGHGSWLPSCWRCFAHLSLANRFLSSSQIHSMGVGGRGFEVLTAAWLSEGKGAWLSFLIMIAC